jgi:hypothetical protein
MSATGMYFRVERDGHFRTLAIEEMTPAERMTTLSWRNPAFLVRIIDHLCTRVKEEEAEV